jgi:hypothetical protein
MFVLLKVVEICGAALIIWSAYYVGKWLGTKIDDDDLTDSKVVITLLGISVYGAISIILLILFTIIEANWNWAIQLTN